MPKGSPELTNARKEEIINACEKLHQTKSFKEELKCNVKEEV